jgi:hypothetical protein
MLLIVFVHLAGKCSMAVRHFQIAERAGIDIGKKTVVNRVVRAEANGL